ncbi:carboxymuconolactone decarboxylase family protein [Komagataeibacter europaeus]|uniref:Carboxymuconolactone decarboxylase family protein n=1 Tax=Komagataeibacter europaeus TaxID=33995 RepID=A0A0M0EFL8_KOMEU|nr:carboxymuconolactone decarboxylase family protein [Komagataeibacter europaeus]KON64054.1 carboxymuconolactone decarboxylase family protein [Komagataeibacter europaeus]
MTDKLLETGRQIRGEVIGEALSERALQAATDFDRPFQELALRYCWGEIWGSEELSRPTRSIINIAMLAAMGKPNELRIHVRGALHNGVTQKEIQEVLLQVCIYAGVPAAGEAFRVAREVFEEEKK